MSTYTDIFAITMGIPPTTRHSQGGKLTQYKFDKYLYIINVQIVFFIIIKHILANSSIQIYKLRFCWFFFSAQDDFNERTNTRRDYYRE